MTPVDQIIASEKLVAIFGYWPKFHDAEVISFRMCREESELGPGPTIDVLIHAFEMTSEVDGTGHFVLRNHVLVDLRFSGVRDLQLDGFNQQNVLFGLSISRAPVESTFRISLDPSWGIAAEFRCEKVGVVRVRPCDKDGHARD